MMIRMPKTRSWAANHQAARTDQIDIVNFLSAMYAEAPQGNAVAAQDRECRGCQTSRQVLSVKTLEIYLQEVQVSTYLERVKPDAKVLIELRSSGFAPTLDRCIDFLQCGVPPNTWYYLFRRAEFPEQRFGRMGVDGKRPASTSDAWQQKNFPNHSSKTRGRVSQYICMYTIVYAHISFVESKHQVDARSFVDHLLNRP